MISTPNLIAYAALLTWPLVALMLYRLYHPTVATTWCILGGYLLLPVGTSIKIEMIPQFDKDSIPSLCALFACILILGRGLKPWRRFGVVELLALMLLVGPVITSLQNTDDAVMGGRLLPGVGLYDGVSALISQIIVLIPFFLGRALFREEKDIRLLLTALAAAATVYSIPALLEVRLSPQLHTWIYGYFPHEFLQQMRDGGFRPVVFLGHGLMVAFLFSTALAAATYLGKTGVKLFRISANLVAIWLALVLLLCKSLGPAIYAIVLVPLVKWTSAATQFRFALVLAGVTLIYPALRTFDLVPTTAIIEAAELISSDRAGSLGTRFENEEKLLAHAHERFWFGWGRYGRSRIYDDYGRDVSITDGHWIIVLGQFGLLGFVAEFGLLFFSIYTAYRLHRRGKFFPLASAAHALILGVNLLDLLPNASIRPWTWLLAGALLGSAEAAKAVVPIKVQAKLKQQAEMRATAPQQISEPPTISLAFRERREH